MAGRPPGWPGENELVTFLGREIDGSGSGKGIRVRVAGKGAVKCGFKCLLHLLATLTRIHLPEKLKRCLGVSGSGKGIRVRVAVKGIRVSGAVKCIRVRVAVKGVSNCITLTRHPYSNTNNRYYLHGVWV